MLIKAESSVSFLSYELDLIKVAFDQYVNTIHNLKLPISRTELLHPLESLQKKIDRAVSTVNQVNSLSEE